jgi:5'-nucleotidase / UDP-sugar diphosphatase
MRESPAIPRPRALRRLCLAAALLLAGHATSAAPIAEPVTLLHVGDQESWLLSAQGNLVRDTTQQISFYGGIASMATLFDTVRSGAGAAGRAVVSVNAGDAFLPGPRFNASAANLSTALGGQPDFYDAVALRGMGFNAIVFGNHEFDAGAATAAAFARAATTAVPGVTTATYLSANLDFSTTPAFADLVAAGRVAPSVIVDTPKGNRIAIIGATTPLLPTISSPQTVGLKGFDPTRTDIDNLDALVPIIQAEIDKARTVDGATVVILASHLQSLQNELRIVPKLSGVDLVVSGGGHELMAPGCPAATCLPNDVPGVVGYPQVVATKDAGRPALAVTSNFGNRYLGILNVSLDDAGMIARDSAGVPIVDGGSGAFATRMARVSNNPGDADFSAPDPGIKAQVTDPVAAYVAALNAQIIGTSEVALNGARGAVSAGVITQQGVRTGETNLGNLVADAIRWAAGTQVALQNGGGIRSSIAAGNVSVGDTFNVLPFTNLIARFAAVSPEQLKIVLEHALGDIGGGRFPQISGMQIVYDSREARIAIDANGKVITPGRRVLRVALDDGTLLIDNGVALPFAPSISFGTIDFLANGGDGYPFRGETIGLVPTLATSAILYQEALLAYIQAAVGAGGLGGEITAARYAPANARDFDGRLIDVAQVSAPAPLLLLAASLGVLVVTRSRRRLA